jgi:hypothetical protein
VATVVAVVVDCVDARCWVVDAAAVVAL